MPRNVVGRKVKGMRKDAITSILTQYILVKLRNN